MKKIAISLLLLIGLLPLIQSQTVDSIKVEQAGELIKIHYKILNSNPDQVFKVTVLCSINGGLKSELKSLSGDFGDNVVGGRSEYMVLWDVLKDVDEVNSVDFSVRAEMIKDNSLSSKALAKRRIHALFVGEFPGPQLGIELGYIGSWGISAKYLKGEIFSVGSLDLTKRFINTKKFKMHLFAGMGIVSESKNESFSDNSTNTRTNMFEGGLIWSINRLVFSVGYSEWKRNDAISTHCNYGFMGLGMRF